MNMPKFVAVLAAGFAAVATPAFAQMAGSSAQGLASAGAGAAAINTFNSAPAPDHVSINSVPTVFAPGLAGGANPCSVSTSGGVAAQGFGISFGNSSSDSKCDERNWFILAMSAYKATNNPQFLNMAVAIANKANAGMELPVALAYYQAAPVAQAPSPMLAATNVGSALTDHERDRRRLCQGITTKAERKFYKGICG